MPTTVTLPASSNHELGFDLGRMKRVVFSHREGLVRDAVHVKSHVWDFHVEDIVMPFLVTDLQGQGGGWLSVKRPPSLSPKDAAMRAT